MKQEADKGFNLVRWSVEHPSAILAYFMAILVLGYIAISYFMPRRMMPYVESPLLGIATEMPGLSAREMETYFSGPIEQRMINVSKVRYIRSVSQDGFSMVVLEFPYGTDMQRAQSEVQSLLNIVQADLPATGANLKPSWIVKVDPLNLPVLSLALTGDSKKGWTLARLRELADNELLNRLKAAHPNVYTVASFGGHRRQLQVRVNRDKLKNYGLSLLDVRMAIDEQNVAKSAGNLTSETDEPILRIDSLARDASTVGSYPIKAVGNQIVRVRDVATVVDGTIEHRSAYRIVHRDQASDAILVNVLQNPDASSPVTIQAIEKAIRGYEKDYPGIKFEVAYNNAKFVDKLFENMGEELAIAILLTGLTIFFFLGQMRGTFISLTAIPTSIAITLLTMAPLGLSINSSTLIGLVLSLGRLVDDAIIDIHSVERHLRMGKDLKTATIDGISEVRRSVLAATIVLIIALIPLMVSGGVTQLMFVGLCWPILIGAIASYIVSMTLTSVLCSKFLKLPGDRKQNWFTRLVLQPFEGRLTRMESGYERLVRWLLKRRFVSMVWTGIALLLGFVFYNFIGSEMMPLADVGQASLQMELKPGKSFAHTEKAVKQLEKILIQEGGKQGWLEHASIEIGVEGGPGMTTGGTYFTGYQMNSISSASAMLTFIDKDMNRPSIWTIMDKVQSRAMAEIPDIRRIQIKEMGSDVMATSLSPVALIVYGEDFNTLDKMGREIMRIAEQDALNPKTKKPDIAQPFLSWEMTKPSYSLIVDRDKAATHGLSPAKIADQAYYSLRGGFAMEFFRIDNKRPTTVQIRYEGDQRYDLSSLDGMFVSGSSGEQVPLLELVRLEKKMEPSAIEHDQLRRVISFGGYYRKDGRPSMDTTMDVQMRAMSQMNFPPGYGIEARGDMTQMMESFRNMTVGLLIVLVLMYFILVAQFGGFLQPLQMLLSLPLELTGVFFLLWLMNQAFSTVSILGVIVLTGIHIATAILLIDLILRYREDGLPRNEAVAKACPQRLRPILMTSLITILTVVPVAFFPSSGIDAYQPLGTVVIGGLIAGTILALLGIPILHTLIDDLMRWIQVRFMKVDPATLPPVDLPEETTQ